MESAASTLHTHMKWGIGDREEEGECPLSVSNHHKLQEGWLEIGGDNFQAPNCSFPENLGKSEDRALQYGTQSQRNFWRQHGEAKGMNAEHGRVKSQLRPLLWLLAGLSGVLEKQGTPQKKDLGTKLWGPEKIVTLKLLPLK